MKSYTIVVGFNFCKSRFPNRQVVHIVFITEASRKDFVSDLSLVDLCHLSLLRSSLSDVPCANHRCYSPYIRSRTFTQHSANWSRMLIEQTTRLRIRRARREVVAMHVCLFVPTKNMYNSSPTNNMYKPKFVNCLSCLLYLIVCVHFLLEYFRRNGCSLFNHFLLCMDTIFVVYGYYVVSAYFQ